MPPVMVIYAFSGSPVPRSSISALECCNAPAAIHARRGLEQELHMLSLVAAIVHDEYLDI